MRRGRDAELVGGDLDQRGLDALAELGLAGEDGDAAIGVDANPAVEQRRLGEVAGQLRRACGDRRGRSTRAKATTSAPPASSLRRDSAVTASAPPRSAPPPPIATAARRTARRMRMCVPQRQRLGAMCARSSASVGRWLALEQRLRPHDHAGDAVAALGGLLGLESLAERAGLAVLAQALERASPLRPCTAAIGSRQERPACRRPARCRRRTGRARSRTWRR